MARRFRSYARGRIARLVGRSRATLLSDMTASATSRSPVCRRIRRAPSVLCQSRPASSATSNYLPPRHLQPMGDRRCKRRLRTTGSPSVRIKHILGQDEPRIERRIRSCRNRPDQLAERTISILRIWQSHRAKLPFGERDQGTSSWRRVQTPGPELSKAASSMAINLALQRASRINATVPLPPAR